MSRWIVPLDDTNTMLLELRHVPDPAGATPDWWVDRGKMLPGQLAMDTHEKSQRTPGDFEAQVSQRPIAVHGLEHLSATDRGVTMFRNLVRKGIRAVRDGLDPQGLSRNGNMVLPTFCNDTVVHQPATGDAAADAEMLRAIGRRLAEGYVKDPPLQPR
jgi:hypothetical protein